jgi:hypothetical protein
MTDGLLLGKRIAWFAYSPRKLLCRSLPEILAVVATNWIGWIMQVSRSDVSVQPPYLESGSRTWEPRVHLTLVDT